MEWRVGIEAVAEPPVDVADGPWPVIAVHGGQDAPGQARLVHHDGQGLFPVGIEVQVRQRAEGKPSPDDPGRDVRWGVDTEELGVFLGYRGASGILDGLAEDGGQPVGVPGLLLRIGGPAFLDQTP